MVEPKQTREAHDEARHIRHEAERRARDILEDARKQSQAMLTEARTAADAVLEDSKKLADALRTTGGALSAEADRLMRDVQLAHRELLGALRLPGVEARDRAARSGPAAAAKPPARPEPEEIFEPPDWVGGP
jgi:cell division septum initiation protein DivIVA